MVSKKCLWSLAFIFKAFYRILGIFDYFICWRLNKIWRLYKSYIMINLRFILCLTINLVYRLLNLIFNIWYTFSEMAIHIIHKDLISLCINIKQFYPFLLIFCDQLTANITELSSINCFDKKDNIHAHNNTHTSVGDGKRH